MAQEQQRRPRHGKPHEGQVSDPIKQRIAEQEQRVAEQDDMAHALAEGVLAYDRKLTARIDAIERDLWRYDERLRIELKRYAPRASDWLSYLVVLLVGAVVANVFLLHMGELFGWGLTDRYNALLEVGQTALTGDASMLPAGVGGGLWALVELFVGLTVSLPLGILHFLQVIIPEPALVMGLPEGALLALIAWILVTACPLSTYLSKRAEFRAAKAQSAGEIAKSRKALEETRITRDEIRNSDLYRMAVEEERRAKELEEGRRAARG